jgi:hypothetical protein
MEAAFWSRKPERGLRAKAPAIGRQRPLPPLVRGVQPSSSTLPRLTYF